MDKVAEAVAGDMPTGYVWLWDGIFVGVCEYGVVKLESVDQPKGMSRMIVCKLLARFSFLFWPVGA